MRINWIGKISPTKRGGLEKNHTPNNHNDIIERKSIQTVWIMILKTILLFLCTVHLTYTLPQKDQQDTSLTLYEALLKKLEISQTVYQPTPPLRNHLDPLSGRTPRVVCPKAPKEEPLMTHCSVSYQRAIRLAWIGSTQSNSDQGDIYYWEGKEIFQLSSSNKNSALTISNKLMAWHGFDGSDLEIFLWDGSQIKQLTNNTYEDNTPQVWDNMVVWHGFRNRESEVFMWSGSEIIQLTNNIHPDGNPHIYKNRIVWTGEDGHDFEIYLWNGKTVAQITNDSSNNFHPRLSETSVVWECYDGHDEEICQLREGNLKKITNNDYADIWPIVSQDCIVWRGQINKDLSGWELFFWNGSTVTQLTNNTLQEGAPAISGEHVVWHVSDGNDNEIFQWQGKKINQLTTNETEDINPQVAGDCIVWQGYDGNDYEIFLWNGQTIIQITDNDFDDIAPVIAQL